MVALSFFAAGLALLSLLSFGFVLSKLLCVLLSIVLIIGAATMQRDPLTGFLNPWVIFTLSFIQYYVLGPFETVFLYDAMHYETVIYGHLRPIPGDDLILSRAIIVSLVGLTCVWIGYQVYLFSVRTRSLRSDHKWSFDYSRLKGVILVSFGIGIAAYISFFAKVGFINYVTTPREMRHFLYAKAEAFGFFGDFLATGLVLTSVYILEIYHSRQRRAVVIILALLIPYIYFQMALFSGSRITIVRPVLIIVFYYLLSHGPVRWSPRMLAFAAMLPVFVVVGGIGRSYLGIHDGGKLALLALEQGWKHPADMYGLITQSMDYVQCYDIFLLLANRSYALGYGSTYLKFFYQFIPRSIWPSKPENITIVMSELFRPGQMAKGVSYNSTMLGEMYYNFSMPGIVLGCFLVGVFLAWLYYLGKNRLHSPPLRFIYATLLVSIIEQGRGAFYNISMTYIIFYIIPIFLASRRQLNGIHAVNAKAVSLV